MTPPGYDPVSWAVLRFLRPWRERERLCCLCTFAALVPLSLLSDGYLYTGGSGYRWFYGFPFYELTVRGHPLTGDRKTHWEFILLNFLCYFLWATLAVHFVKFLQRRGLRIGTGPGTGCLIAASYLALYLILSYRFDETLRLLAELLR
jgi:hypothetical protein